MPYEIIAPAALWTVAGLAIALIVHGVAKRREQAVRRRLTWRAGGFALLGGAAIPSAIQYWATDGAQAWAGLLMAAVGAGLLWRSITRPGDAEAPTAFSFREKSAAAGIVALLAVYGWSTFQVLTSSLTLETAFRWLAVSSIAMIVVMVALHAAFALVHKPEETDERDRIVGWRSARNGYGVMAVGVWGTMMAIAAGAPAAVPIYALLGSFVAAELVRLASELVYYRLDL